MGMWQDGPAGGAGIAEAGFSPAPRRQRDSSVRGRLDHKVHVHRDGSGIPSRASIMGHPIHPTMIPFPLTYLSSVLITDIAYRRTRDPFWARASSLLLKAGLVSGVAAGAVGAIDYAGIRRVRRHPEGPVHAFGNVAALALSAWNLKRRSGSHAAEPGDVAISASVALLLGITALAGGELIYRHKIAPVGREHPEGR